MRNILIVDDSVTMRRMIQASLRGLSDTSITQAGNGLEAIERLALAPVDLIIADLNMPDMHGLELVQFVRKQRAYHGIPIIILTTRGDEASRGAALAAGASHYLTKPFLPEMLAAEVHRVLNPA